MRVAMRGLVLLGLVGAGFYAWNRGKKALSNAVTEFAQNATETGSLNGYQYEITFEPQTGEWVARVQLPGTEGFSKVVVAQGANADDVRDQMFAYIQQHSAQTPVPSPTPTPGGEPPALIVGDYGKVTVTKTAPGFYTLLVSFQQPPTQTWSAVTLAENALNVPADQVLQTAQNMLAYYGKPEAEGDTIVEMVMYGDAHGSVWKRASNGEHYYHYVLTSPPTGGTGTGPFTQKQALDHLVCRLQGGQYFTGIGCVQ